MGRRDRERRERIRAGTETSIAAGVLDNLVARKAVALASRGTVIAELQKAETSEQIDVLSSISPSKVGKAIRRKAPSEMDKGIRTLQKQGKLVTINALCAEIKSTPGFLAMCEQAG